jgi:hypothetical protein
VDAQGVSRLEDQGRKGWGAQGAGQDHATFSAPALGDDGPEGDAGAAGLPGVDEVRLGRGVEVLGLGTGEVLGQDGLRTGKGRLGIGFPMVEHVAVGAHHRPHVFGALHAPLDLERRYPRLHQRGDAGDQLEVVGVKK